MRDSGNRRDRTTSNTFQPSVWKCSRSNAPAGHHLPPRALVKTPSHLPNWLGASRHLPEVEAGCRSPKSCYTMPAWCFTLWHRDAQGGVPVAAPPRRSCPWHGVAVRGCGLRAQAVAAAHARSPLQLCTHARSEKLQRALLAALQNQGGPQQGILTTPKSHPGTPPVQSHRERGNSTRRAAGTGTRTQPVFPLDLDILQPPCGFTSSPSLRTWLRPRIPPQSPAPALTCSWPGRRWRSGGSCPAVWPPGAVFWRWRPSRRCPRRPWP